MTRRPSRGPALLLLGLLLLVAYALSIPMRNGARLWEAVAVIPQIVLWYVPLLFAIPVLVWLAWQLRPDWTARSSPRLEEDSVPGTLAFFADVLRRAPLSPLARSRVVGQLVRLAVRIVAQRRMIHEEEAWRVVRHHCEERDPEVGRFLDGVGLAQMPANRFRALMIRTIELLDRESEEV
jgi:hypothetical protein